VLRRCGRSGGSDAADAIAAMTARIKIPPTEGVVGRRSGLTNGSHTIIELFE
jgi:hypothetical protein